MVRKSLAGNSVPVQVRSAAPNQSTNFDTKTAFRFGGLFLRLCPESLGITGFPGFFHFRRWRRNGAGCRCEQRSLCQRSQNRRFCTPLLFRASKRRGNVKKCSPPLILFHGILRPLKGYASARRYRDGRADQLPVIKMQARQVEHFLGFLCDFGYLKHGGRLLKRYV